MMSTILIIFLVGFIGISIWNTLNLHTLIKRPMRNDLLNDKAYWELKYKMQYMLTVFAVIVAIISYLGYNSINSIHQDIKKEIALQLDSTKRAIDTLEIKQQNIGARIAANDSVVNVAQNAILGLTDREKLLNGSLTMRSTDLDKLKNRITEINEKNIIQQNIYIVENLEYTFNETWEYKRYYFKDMVTNTGQRLPKFNPFILAVSNQGFGFSIKDVTNEFFDLIVSEGSYSEYGTLKNIKATLFITEKP